MYKQNPLTSCDSYKLGHGRMYPEGTEYVYSNFTPRSLRLAPSQVKENGKVLWFGLQGFLFELDDLWNENFFQVDIDVIVREFERRVVPFVGPSGFNTQNVIDLWNLRYLPIEVKALPEGSWVKPGIPCLTITNTDPRFAWLVNYLESWLSAELWKPATSATIAGAYRKLLNREAELTGTPIQFVDWQGHDFSMRGMSGCLDAAKSGAGHLVSFLGTDSLQAVDWLEEYYSGRSTFVGGSVPATEHSVMSMYGPENELDLFRRLIVDLYPSGVISIVSDTFDFWKVITEYTKTLKTEILGRVPDENGLAKVVFRPDSGNPVDIVCGTARFMSGVPTEEKFLEKYGSNVGIDFLRNENDEFYRVSVSWDGENFMPSYTFDRIKNPTPEMKGAIQCLWEVFGGTTTSTGHRLLNERVGLIYGDSITLDRATAILERLRESGYASGNVVFGVGSFTYQFTTRDTLGFAMKATWGKVRGDERIIFKEPKTDDGTKKSARGLLAVQRVDGEYFLIDDLTEKEYNATESELKVVYLNGSFPRTQTLEQIRERTRNS